MALTFSVSKTESRPACRRALITLGEIGPPMSCGRRRPQNWAASAATSRVGFSPPDASPSARITPAECGRCCVKRRCCPLEQLAADTKRTHQNDTRDVSRRIVEASLRAISRRNRVADNRACPASPPRAAYQKAGSGTLEALREADPELVAEDSERLGAALRRVLDGLPDGGNALVVGHSPTNEASVLGLTGEVVAPLAKGAGVRVLAGDDRYEIEPLE
jgi:hypothetical protein